MSDKSAKQLCSKLFTLIIIMFVLMFVAVTYLTFDTLINYSLDSEVITTENYNEMYNESFKGRIVANGEWYGINVLVQDDNGTQREFRKGHIVKV